MKYVRGAEIDEVLRAAPECEDTRNEVRNHVGVGYGVWIVDATDLATIPVHAAPNEPALPIEAGFVRWMTFIQSGTAFADKESRRWETLRDTLARGEPFTTRPIIRDDSRTVIDGAHRFLAAYKHSREHLPFTLEVYWNCRA
jgi:hypothetical protein